MYKELTNAIEDALIKMEDKPENRCIVVFEREGEYFLTCLQTDQPCIPVDADRYIKIFGWDSTEYLLSDENDNEEAIATARSELFSQLADEYEKLWNIQPEFSYKKKSQ